MPTTAMYRAGQEAEQPPDVRIARFHESSEVVDGIPLQVVENTADTGDVLVMHSLLLHAAPHTPRQCSARPLLILTAHAPRPVVHVSLASVRSQHLRGKWDCA